MVKNGKAGVRIPVEMATEIAKTLEEAVGLLRICRFRGERVGLAKEVQDRCGYRAYMLRQLLMFPPTVAATPKKKSAPKAVAPAPGGLALGQE